MERGGGIERGGERASGDARGLSTGRRAGRAGGWRRRRWAPVATGWGPGGFGVGEPARDRGIQIGASPFFFFSVRYVPLRVDLLETGERMDREVEWHSARKYVEGHVFFHKTIREGAEKLRKLLTLLAQK